MPKDNYSILSLDGGGCWALIQARALFDIYGDIPGRELLAHFDLVAANSGGSIVAGSLAANMKTSEIVERFLTESWRRKMFVDLPWYRRIPRSLLDLGPRFSTEAKLDGLRETFGPTADVLLPELPKEIRNSGKISPHFLIVGFDYDRERVVFFRSDTASRAGSFSARPPVTLAQAVHA